MNMCNLASDNFGESPLHILNLCVCVCVCVCVYVYVFTRAGPVFQCAYCINVPMLNNCVCVFVLVLVCVLVGVCVCDQVLCPYFSTHCVLTSGLAYM